MQLVLEANRHRRVSSSHGDTGTLLLVDNRRLRDNEILSEEMLMSPPAVVIANIPWKRATPSTGVSPLQAVFQALNPTA